MIFFKISSIMAGMGENFNISILVTKEQYLLQRSNKKTEMAILKSLLHNKGKFLISIAD